MAQIRTLTAHRIEIADWLDARERAGLAVRLATALLGAALVGLAAQVRCHVPWTPVPVTGQVLAVLAVGALLGARDGAAALAIYLGAGLLGMPWMAGVESGMALLSVPSVGYLFGFVVAAALIGRLSRLVGARSLEAQLVIMLIGLLPIHLCGALGLMLVTGCGFGRALMIGLAPFLALDLLKVVIAAAITSRLFARPGAR